MHKSLVNHSRYVEGMLASISNRRELTQDDFQAVLGALRGAHAMLSKTLETAAGMSMPVLTNVETGQPLATLLRREPLIRNLHHDVRSLESQWIGTFLSQLHEVIGKLAASCSRAWAVSWLCKSKLRRNGWRHS